MVQLTQSQLAYSEPKYQMTNVYHPMFPDTPGFIPQVTVQVDATYQILPTDDNINCDGTFTVTLVNENEVIKEVTVTSTNGTVTMAGDVTIETPSTITTGASETFYLERGQWWHK